MEIMTDWKHDGVRVIPAGSLDTNTAQTPGMNRAAAINFARVGARVTAVDLSEESLKLARQRAEV